MKKAVALLSAVTVGLIGCAHDRHYSQYRDRHYVNGEHPSDVVVIDRDGTRTYIREYDGGRDPDYPENIMEPRFRGKAPESLGWNTENYYRQRGYR